MKRSTINSALAILVILALFIYSSYLIQNYIDFFVPFLDLGFIGMTFFVLILIVSIVFAPISAVPFFPLASNLWGWVIAAILGVIGWTIGAVIAFWLARRYGVELVSKFLPMKTILKFEEKIPASNLFWTVVVLRMVIAIDGVSYLFGLFTRMSYRSFTLATFIGLIPFTVVVSYLGTMPFIYQLLFSVFALILFGLGVFVAYLRKRKKEKTKVYKLQSSN